MEVKEFKEAIMFLENTLYMCIRGEDEMPGYKVKYNHWIKKVISLLQQGEALKAENVELKAYKQIVEEINEMLRVDIANNTYDYNALDCAEGYLHQIKLIEQKYLKEERK